MQIPISVTVNGRRHALQIDTRATLVHMLREDLGLTERTWAAPPAAAAPARSCSTDAR